MKKIWSSRVHGLGDAIEWTAKITSIVSIVILLMMVFGEGSPSGKATSLAVRDIIGLIFFPAGIVIGMVLAWKWERLGGRVTIISLGLFYVALFVFDGKFPGGLWFIGFSAPGFLFLLAGILHDLYRHQIQQQLRL